MCVACGCETAVNEDVIEETAAVPGSDGSTERETDTVRVAEQGDIPEGEVRLFHARDTAIAVANVAGTFYAFDDLCTHQRCSLSDGDLEGAAIICPCHGSRFDVVTGAVLNPPARVPVTTYPTEVQGDGILVRLGAPAH